MDENRVGHRTPMNVGGASHEGLKPTQEDRFGIYTIQTADGMSATLLMVADGVGGQSAGELASHLAVQSVTESVIAAQPSSSELAGVLAEALRQSNDRLHRDVIEHPDRSGMATTFTAVAVVGNRLVLAHVGDSRAYLFRRGLLHQLTVDHTWAQEAILAGRPVEEVRRHPNRNVIKRYLGIHTSVDVDTRYLPPNGPQGTFVDALEQPLFLHADDSVFLCSDGVTDVLPPKAIAKIIARLPAAQAAQAIIDAALRAGASDNVTAVVMDMPQARKRTFPLAKAIALAGLGLLLLGGGAWAAASWRSDRGDTVGGLPTSPAQTAPAAGQVLTEEGDPGQGVQVVPVEQASEDAAAQSLSATSTLVPTEAIVASPSPTESDGGPTATRVPGTPPSTPSPSLSAVAADSHNWTLISPSEGPGWIHGDIVPLRWQCSPGLAPGQMFSLRIMYEDSPQPVLADYRTTSTSYDFRPDPLKTGRYDWEVLILRADTSQIVDRHGWHFSWSPSAPQAPGAPIQPSPPEATATNAPAPTATHTAAPPPTDTPLPPATDTPVPPATDTPVPTATLQPTSTPVPAPTGLVENPPPSITLPPLP